MKTAFLYPGQGAQNVGMGQDLYAWLPVVQQTYQEASEVLGFDVARVSFEGPAEELNRTDRAQPAIATLSVAITRVLAEKGVKPEACAGHSLGEYPALAAAGVLSFRDMLGAIKVRGSLMQQACQDHPGGMIALVGGEEEAVNALCERAAGRGYIAIANYNTPVQFVVSGQSAALDEAERLSGEMGVKRAVRLTVAGGFHSRLMDSAADGYRAAVEKFNLQAPRMPVYFNLTGRSESDPVAIRRLMTEQVNHPVQWVSLVRNLKAGTGVEQALEIGPGKVLQGLLKKIDSALNVYTLSDRKSVEEYLHALSV